MLGITAPSLLAFAAGAAVALAGPQIIRPVVKTALKGAYIIGGKLQEIQAEIREELEDISVEVQEDLAASKEQTAEK